MIKKLLLCVALPVAVVGFHVFSCFGRRKSKKTSSGGTQLSYEQEASYTPRWASLTGREAETTKKDFDWGSICLIHSPGDKNVLFGGDADPFNFGFGTQQFADAEKKTNNAGQLVTMVGSSGASVLGSLEHPDDWKPGFIMKAKFEGSVGHLWSEPAGNSLHPLTNVGVGLGAFLEPNLKSGARAFLTVSTTKLDLQGAKAVAAICQQVASGTLTLLEQVASGKLTLPEQVASGKFTLPEQVASGKFTLPELPVMVMTIEGHTVRRY